MIGVITSPVSEDLIIGLRELTQEELGLVSGGDMTWMDVAFVGAAAIIVGAVAVACIPAAGALLAGATIFGFSAGVTTQVAFGIGGAMSIAMGSALFASGVSHSHSW
jgi:hypothetical protein